MSIYNTNNKFITYLIILATLFVVVLFTKDQIIMIQENNDLRDSYEIKLKDTKAKLEAINEKKAMLNKSSENIDKYDLVIKEDEVIDYLYGYIEESNRKNGVSIIKSISITEPKDTELGFKETQINLNILVPSEEKLKRILDFLTSPKSKYNFFIDSFTYPYWEIKWNFEVTIPLKILYK